MRWCTVTTRFRAYAERSFKWLIQSATKETCCSFWATLTLESCSFTITRCPNASLHNQRVFNPLRMRRRVTVVCLSVCASVTAQTARVLASAAQAWYQRNQLDTYKVSDSWILLKAVCSKLITLFTSPIGTAIHDKLWKATLSNPTGSATFDHANRGSLWSFREEVPW